MPGEPQHLADLGFSQVGGHVALDLLNTVDWRLDPAQRIERLTDMGCVLAWCRTTGLVSTDEHARLAGEADRHPRVAAREHRAVLAWRETVYGALTSGSARALTRVTDGVRESLGRAHLVPSAGAWRWEDTHLSLTTPRDRIARVTLDLVTDGRLAYLSQCGDEACGWVYLDTSPRHNRRWCIATDCGNRNRARRYAERHRATGAAPRRP